MHEIAPSTGADAAQAQQLPEAPATRGVAARDLACIETHPARVFIVRDEALKLKKPLRERHWGRATPGRWPAHGARAVGRGLRAATRTGAAATP